MKNLKKLMYVVFGSLRKAVDPNQDKSRRTDYSIQIWVQEAKNVAPKKR